MIASLYRWCLAHEVTRWRGGTRLQTLLERLAPQLQSYALRSAYGTLYIDVASENLNWLTRDLFIRPRSRYEPHVQRVLHALIRPADTTVDIGANLGLHTLLMSSLAKRVIAFEPNRKILPLLRRTLAARPNVELHECAVFDYSGTLTFFVSPDHCMGSVFSCREDAIEVSVPCKRLADVVAGPVDVIKVDAEGAEAGVFRGALPLLDREQAPILVYEDWSPKDSELRPILDELQARYVHFIIRRDGQVDELKDQDVTWCEMLAVPASRLEWALQQLASAPPIPPGPVVGA